MKCLYSYSYPEITSFLTVKQKGERDTMYSFAGSDEDDNDYDFSFEERKIFESKLNRIDSAEYIIEYPDVHRIKFEIDRVNVDHLVFG